MTSIRQLPPPPPPPPVLRLRIPLQQDNVVLARECHEILSETKELTKQMGEHMKQLSQCEAAIEEQQRWWDARHSQPRQYNAIEDDLDQHRCLIMQQNKNNEALLDGYHQLVLGMLMRGTGTGDDDDAKRSDWLSRRRAALFQAFEAAGDVHELLMQRGDSILLPACRRKPYSMRDGGQRALRSGKQY